MLKFALVLLLYVQITTTKTLAKRSRNVVSNGVGQAFYSEVSLCTVVNKIYYNDMYKTIKIFVQNNCEIES